MIKQRENKGKTFFPEVIQLVGGAMLKMLKHFEAMLNIFEFSCVNKKKKNLVSLRESPNYIY